MSLVGSKRARSSSDDASSGDVSADRASSKRRLAEIVDAAEAVSELDDVELRRLLLRLEKACQANQEARVRFAEEPSRFMDSELELDQAIKALAPLAATRHLYPVLCKLGSMATLASLLAHDNADIAVDVVALLAELMSDDLFEDAEDESKPAAASRLLLLEEIKQHHVLPAAVENLSRFDPVEDAQAIFNVLNLASWVTELAPSRFAEFVPATSSLYPWLVRFCARSDVPVDENLVSASDLLSTCVLEAASLDTVLAPHIETLLIVLARWKKTDPVGLEETEFAHNLFQALARLLVSAPCRTAFLDAQGYQLFARMLRERMWCALRALTALTFALADNEAGCAGFVQQAAGLRVLFPYLAGMAGWTRKQRRHYEAGPASEVALAAAVLGRLLRCVVPGSPLHLRVMAKCCDRDGYFLTQMVLKSKAFVEEDPADAAAVHWLLAYMAVCPVDAGGIDGVVDVISTALQSSGRSWQAVADSLAFLAAGDDEDEAEVQRLQELAAMLQQALAPTQHSVTLLPVLVPGDSGDDAVDA